MILMREMHAGLQHLDLRGHGHLVQHAVDAVADAQVVFQRLDVDVGRALVQRLAHDLVDEADDGRLGVLLVEDVDLLLQVERGVVDVAPLEDLVEGRRADAVTGAQRGQDVAARRHAPGDRLLDFLRDDLPRREVERIVGQQDRGRARSRRTG